MESELAIARLFQQSLQHLTVFFTLSHLCISIMIPINKMFSSSRKIPKVKTLKLSVPMINHNLAYLPCLIISKIVKYMVVHMIIEISHIIVNLFILISFSITSVNNLHKLVINRAIIPLVSNIFPQLSEQTIRPQTKIILLNFPISKILTIWSVLIAQCHQRFLLNVLRSIHKK